MSDCRYCSDDEARCIRDQCRVCCGCGRELRPEPRAPRFAMFYAEPKNDVLDDGEDIEITLKIPRAWVEAPIVGLQHVVCRREDGRMQVLFGDDVFMTMPNGEIIKTNDPLAQLLSIGMAKLGLWVPDPIFRASQERANRWRSEQVDKEK